MTTLRNKLNKFHKEYDLTFRSTHMTKADMHDHDALMSAYEQIWETMEYCCDDDHEWLSALYNELGDYITTVKETKPMKKQTIRKIRKALAVTRLVSILTMFVCLLLAACTVGDSNVGMSAVCVVVGVVCFGIAYAIDQILN